MIFRLKIKILLVAFIMFKWRKTASESAKQAPPWQTGGGS